MPPLLGGSGPGRRAGSREAEHVAGKHSGSPTGAAREQNRAAAPLPVLLPQPLPQPQLRLRASAAPRWRGVPLMKGREGVCGAAVSREGVAGRGVRAARPSELVASGRLIPPQHLHPCVASGGAPPAGGQSALRNRPQQDEASRCRYQTLQLQRHLVLEIWEGTALLL